MEPVSIPAQRGTLEDPEVLQNVPGHVIPILQREYDDFKTESTKFLAGEMPEDEFIKFRLKQGVYGQRQADVQMIRVKLPFGGVTPEQMESFADVIEKYVPLNKGHITTRQNIQMHHVPLMDAEKLIREIGETGLSSREGCGNTMRNVTGDPWAGVAKDELFDLTPYVGAYVRYFVRHPTTQAMPRKVKTSFDGGPRDRAISGIHDVAFRARVRESDDPARPGEVRGVEMLVGGGTSIMPRKAQVLYEFLELENGEYLKVTEAVIESRIQPGRPPWHGRHRQRLSQRHVRPVHANSRDGTDAAAESQSSGGKNPSSHGKSRPRCRGDPDAGCHVRIWSAACRGLPRIRGPRVAPAREAEAARQTQVSTKARSGPPLGQFSRRPTFSRLPAPQELEIPGSRERFFSVPRTSRRSGPSNSST